jgi:predicted RNase H-like HicB family nuclease
MRQYIALIHKEPGSEFGVSFPDLPGCITAGADLDEARDMAAEALGFHLEGLEQDGEPIPEPSTLETVMKDPANRAGVAILVEAPARSAKTVRVNITLPDDVLQAIDRHAEANGLSRSGFLTLAAKKALAA